MAEPEPDVDEPESSFDALDVPVLAEAGSGLDTVDFPLDVLVLPSSPSDAVLSEALSSAAFFAAPVPVDVVAVASSVESEVSAGFDGSVASDSAAVAFWPEVDVSADVAVSVALGFAVSGSVSAAALLRATAVAAVVVEESSL